MIETSFSPTPEEPKNKPKEVASWPEKYYPKKYDKLSLFLQRFVGPKAEKFLTYLGVLEPAGNYRDESHSWEEYLSGLSPEQRSMFGMVMRVTKAEDAPTPTDLVSVVSETLQTMPEDRDTLVFYDRKHQNLSDIVVCTGEEYSQNNDPEKIYLLVCDTTGGDDDPFTTYQQFPPHVVGSIGLVKVGVDQYTLGFGGDHLALDGKQIAMLLDKMMPRLEFTPLAAGTKIEFSATNRKCITYSSKKMISAYKVTLKVAQMIRQADETVSFVLPVLTDINRTVGDKQYTVQRLGVAHVFVTHETTIGGISSQLRETKERAEAGKGVTEAWFRMESPRNRLLRAIIKALEGSFLGKNAHDHLLGDVVLSILPSHEAIAATTAVSRVDALNITITAGRQITISGNEKYWDMPALNEILQYLISAEERT